MGWMNAGHQARSDRTNERHRKRGGSHPFEGFKITMLVEETEPGSALDEQLRQEQAKAIFDLLAAARPNAKGD